MRIIAGEFRGRVLKAPDGLNTRPTTDRVRESLMSALHSALGSFDDTVVLDAFAGSGALGLEALSRGARLCFFFEKNAQSFSTVKANIALLGLDARRAILTKADAFGAARLVAQPLDLVLLDPPYAYLASDIFSLLDSLHAAGKLRENAVVSYEHAAVSCAEVDACLARSATFVLDSRRTFGDITIDILVMRSSEQACE